MSEEEEEELELLESELELLALRREADTACGCCCTDSGFSLAEQEREREEGGVRAWALQALWWGRGPGSPSLTLLGGLLGRVQLPTDILQAFLQLPLLLQGQLFLRLAHRLLQGCGGREGSV